MLKFMFMRQAEPDTPTWNNGAAYWQAVESDRHPGLSEDVWRWLRGERNRPDLNGTGKSLDDLSGAMEGGDEAVRLDAAYKLAAMRKQSVPILMSALRREACANGHLRIAKNPTNPQGGNPADIVAVHGLSAVGVPAVPALTDALEEESCNVRAAAAATLGNIGPPAASAIEALARCLKDESLWVRRNAAEAIGTIGTGDSGAVVALSDLVTDRIELVRRNAIIALGKLGNSAGSAVPALASTLHDKDRYTQFHASLALQQIGTAEAHKTLLSALFTARWCPHSSRENPY